MVRMARAVVLVLASLCAASAEPLVRHLHELQTAAGGFREPSNETPDLETTAHALFLASLYGQKAQLNADDAARFVQSLSNSNDFGYGVAPGKPSDLFSTRYALQSYLHLGKAIPDSQKVSDYVRSLFDLNTGMVGDLRTTALATEALDMAGELQKPAVQEILKRTKDALSEKVTSSETENHFTLDAASPSPVSDNYYAIYLGKKSGFKFTDAPKWAAYIKSLQDLDRNSATFGGFFTSPAKEIVTPEATAHAALSLHLLGQDVGVEYALLQYANSRKATIKETSLSHLALAHTKIFKRFISTQFFYQSESSEPIADQVMEGLNLIPMAAVTVFDGQIAHGGFAVSVKEANGWSSPLEFNTDRSVYTAKKDFDTTSKLGALSFTYELSTNVYPLGEIKFTLSDKKSIGYKMNVQAAASFGGRSIEEGESVLPGTEFQFETSFSTASKQNFAQGAFSLSFEVKDSSGVVHHEKTLSGKDNASNKPFQLAYTLSGDDFTSGALSFVLSVSNNEGVHSQHTVIYTLDQQMVASAIEFEGLSAGAEKAFGLGDSITVTMRPAALKDLHTIAAFSAQNADARRFAMDIASANGHTFLTLQGEPSGDVYKFEGAIPASLDAIGSGAVTFRFISAAGNSVSLQPFDTQLNELVEDAASVKLTVNAELHATELTKKPESASFTYGSEIPFEFTITDSKSGAKVSAGETGAVAIVLTSGSGVSAFESARVSASSVGAGQPFTAVLEIDANTVQGDGAIAIKVSAAGEDIPLYFEGRNELVSFPASVGGKIDVEKSVFSTTSLDSTQTAVVVAFSLSCEGKPLKNAHLRASVLNGNEVVNRFSTPLKNLLVAYDTEGKYSFSFTIPHENFETGSYKIQFQRESDLARARQQRDAADKQARKDGKEASAATPDAPVLFDADVKHKTINVASHWMQMELAALLVVISLFWAVSGKARMFKSGKKQ